MLSAPLFLMLGIFLAASSHAGQTSLDGEWEGTLMREGSASVSSRGDHIMCFVEVGVC